MRRSKVELYVHAVWATWRRQPYLVPELERSVYRCIEGESARLGVSILAINGLEDHMHVLAKLPATIAVARLMNQLKGVSSAHVHDQMPCWEHFRWQENYGAFSVSRSHIARVRQYVLDQKRVHSDNDVHADWEETDLEVDA
jgi:putative transposase